MIKIKANEKEIKNFVFIDTDVFRDILTCSSSLESVKELLKKLDSNKIILILPEVILKEIEKEFNSWQEDLLKNIRGNLSTLRILGFREEKTGEGNNNGKSGNKKDKKSEKNKENLELMDKIISGKREELFNEIKGFYEDLQKKIYLIFEHKNTKLVELTECIILRGIKRSLLKKAPCTRSVTKHENAHTKDVDCIAFESIIHFLENEKIEKNSKISLYVKDSDYVTEEGQLKQEIIEDLKKSIKNITYSSQWDELNGKKGGDVKKEDAMGSLADGQELLAENLKLTNLSQ